ncbi:threonine synthase [Clostridia bacterium]|nr:threonine synthase [Clostridia bacterium]
MYYTSTRNREIRITGSEAIVKGLSAEGGLFVPEEIPKLSRETIIALTKKEYYERAYDVLKLFLPDFPQEELHDSVKAAYGENFDCTDISELVRINRIEYFLELWHGPTCAFKDMALQLLPYLLSSAAKRVGSGKTTAILTATSGDTGKAALEGFRDVTGTKIMVFYPENGVSELQKKQMQTSEGGNVSVVAVKGNFDDCQNAVKEIFTDKTIETELLAKNIALSSANSINWGRLCPQIAYYVSVYAELIARGEIMYGEQINIAVPTGNFGNILAAYYAREMGIPVRMLICASNSNNVIFDFLNTGTYDINRDFVTTMSPSMDILISSNLERLLYMLSGGNCAEVAGYYNQLKENGRFTVTKEIQSQLRRQFYAGWASEADTETEIRYLFRKKNYLTDTHTAVAHKVADEYLRETGDETKTVVVSTANPYKFPKAVYESLAGTSPLRDEVSVSAALAELTGKHMPQPLKDAINKPVRFTDVVGKTEIAAAVRKFLL